MSWLRTLQNPLLWWSINRMLDRMNNGAFDPDLLDRTFEWSEAIDCLKRIDPRVVTSSCTDFDYMIQGYKEHLEQEAIKAEIGPFERQVIKKAN